jgi:phospholipid/cholesterol/gamma-HCH transport system substrate-binding protein
MSNVKAGVIGLVVLVVVTLLGFTKNIPFVNQPFEIRAAFQDGSGLRAGSPVRIAGVEVGEVTRVEHSEPGARTVTATMAINDIGRPIRKDATAHIRPRIFLEGNFFVDITPGSPHQPALGAGDVIPIGQTGNPVQIGEILRILQRDTRDDLQTALGELGEAQEAGAGRAFRRSIGPQAQAYRYSAIVAEALGGQRQGDLGRWIRNQGVVSAALDENPRQLRALIDNFSVTAAALADRSTELERSVAALGPALEEGLTTLELLNAAFPSVRRLAAESIPAVRSSRPAIRASLPFLVQLRGLVRPQELQGVSRDLRRATPALAKVSARSVPVLAQSRLLASCTTNVLVPHGDQTVPDPNFPASGPVHQEFAKIMPALAGESRMFDANGQWFRVLGSGGSETFDLGNNVVGTTDQPILGVNPPPQRRRPPLEPSVPCETQEIPNLETRQGAAPRRAQSDPNSPAAQERTERAQALATAVLQARMAAEGSDVEVRDEPITERELAQVASQQGLGGQVSRLRSSSDRLARAAREATP